MTEIKYGAWFDDLVKKTGNATATLKFLRAVRTPVTGSGLLAVLDLISKAVHTCSRHLEDYQEWATHLQLLYAATSSLVTKQTSLSKPSNREKALEVYGGLCTLGELGHLKLAPAVLESIGWIILDALRQNEPLSSKTVNQLLTLHRSADRSSPNKEWDALRSMPSLNSECINKVIHAVRGNREAISLAKKLQHAAFIVKAAPNFPSENSNAKTPNNQGAKGQVSEEAQKENGLKPKKTKKDKAEIKPPSVFKLKSAAAYFEALSTFGIEDSWNVLAPARLKKTTAALAADLTLMGKTDRPGMAAVSLLALHINHSIGSTLKLSLLRNDDIWLEKRDANIYFNRRAYVNLSGTPSPTDIIKISLPRKLRSYIKRAIAQNPAATNLAELLEIINIGEWLAKTERYLIESGDQAHKSRSGRFVHSLGLVYMHVGASPELAAFDTLTPHLCGDSSLNYLRFEYTYLKSIREKVALFLDLGEIDSDEDDPEWVGSASCPTDQEYRQAWQHQSTKSASAIKSVRKAKDIEELIVEFNKGSAANAWAYRMPTGARMQLMNHPTRRDVLSHVDYVYTYDKKTQPSSARLTPRTAELDGVICAQGRLLKSANNRLEELGFTETNITNLLRNPSSYSPFFIELFLHKSRDADLSKVGARPIQLETVKAAIPPELGLANNSARHFWGSKCAGNSDFIWAERVLLGHGRKLAIAGSWCTSVAPSSLINAVRDFVRQTLDSLQLDLYAGIKNPTVDLLEPTIHLKGMDNRKSQKSGIGRDMPQTYCNETSLPSIAAVDKIRSELLHAEKEDESEKTLLSIIVSDGITHHQDVRLIWTQLGEQIGQPAMNRLSWTRSSGQDIQMPSQPSTRIHFSRIKEMRPLNDVLLSLKKKLEAILPNVVWPITAEGVLNALCWLTCRWVRLKVSPFLIFCMDPSTTAATFNEKSTGRIFSDGQDSLNRFSDIKELTHRRGRSFDRSSDLQRLSQTVHRIKDGDKGEGEELRRSKRLREALLLEFDEHDCHPFAEFFLTWIHIELSLQIQGGKDPIEVAVIYEYLMRVLHRASSFAGSFGNFDEWRKGDWQAFVVWILNVDDVLEENRSNNLSNRKIALRRIFSSLINAENFAIPDNVLPDLPPAGSRAWCQSASRVFVSERDIADVKVCIDHLYREWEISKAQMHGMLGMTIKACLRSDEANAMRVVHLGCDVAALTTSGFSQIKTEGSRRLGQLDQDLKIELIYLKDLLGKLPEPPTMLFSQDHTRVHLSIGRAMQSVLVDLFRLSTGDSRFVYHTLLGTGLQLQAAPNYERHLVSIFRDGYFPICHAESLINSFAGSDPRHLATCFVHSGHASQRTPAEAYFPIWPYLYAAAMRVTQADERPHPTLIDTIPLKSDQLRRQERSRFGKLNFDEWNWSLLPLRSKRIGSSTVASTETNFLNVTRTQGRTDPISPLLYGVYSLLQIDKAAAEHEARLTRTEANEIDKLLRFSPSYKWLHKRTPGRNDKQDRPKRTSVRDVSLAETREIFNFIQSSSKAALLALDALLTNECPSVTFNDVQLALSAIPYTLKLQLCWPQGPLDGNLILKLSALPRVTGLDTRKHIANGIRVRVVPPGDGPSEVLMTHLTTLTRTAVHVQKLLLNLKEK